MVAVLLIAAVGVAAFRYLGNDSSELNLQAESERNKNSLPFVKVDAQEGERLPRKNPGQGLNGDSDSNDRAAIDISDGRQQIQLSCRDVSFITLEAVEDLKLWNKARNPLLNVGQDKKADDFSEAKLRALVNSGQNLAENAHWLANKLEGQDEHSTEVINLLKQAATHGSLDATSKLYLSYSQESHRLEDANDFDGAYKAIIEAFAWRKIEIKRNKPLSEATGWDFSAYGEDLEKFEEHAKRFSLKGFSFDPIEMEIQSQELAEQIYRDMNLTRSQLALEPFESLDRAPELLVKLIELSERFKGNNGDTEFEVSLMATLEDCGVDTSQLKWE